MFNAHIPISMYEHLLLCECEGYFGIASTTSAMLFAVGFLKYIME